MIRPIEFRPPAWLAFAALLALALLASCGGGVVGSGGTGRSAGVAVGTVSGFGSVIVDGVAYDDRNALVVSETEPGRDAVAEVKLGQRVTVDYDIVGVASVVHVEAALVGSVTGVLSSSQFSMLGQTVTVNFGTAAGPITLFGGGYTSAADVRAGDAVEVHGVLIRQAATYQIQATRIDRQAAAPAYLRITGLVSNLNVDGTAKLTLGALTVASNGAAVLPSSTGLTNGQVVTVLALPGTLTMPTTGAWRVQAAQIRVRELRAGGDLDDYVSGAVSQLDSLAKTLTLGNLLVNYSAAGVTPATRPLANGQYVQVRGKIGADGVMAAAGVTIREAGIDTEAELRGNISGYDSTTRRFSVRDVAVDASSVLTQDLQGCPATGLADGLFVEIDGVLTSSGVVARKVQCENETSDATVEREGTAGVVDIAGKSFSLVRERGTSLSVKWTDKTFFGDVTPQTLAGMQVHVEGLLVGNVLMAKKIKVED